MKRLLAVCLIGAAFAAAATPARADRDAVQFFSNIRVAPDATVHDAVCFFCNADVEGEAKGNVVVFFGNVHIAGKADHDVVNFFGEVSADDKAQIGNSLVSFFGMVRLGEGVSIGRDMVSMFGVVRAPESVSVGNNRSPCRHLSSWVPWFWWVWLSSRSFTRSVCAAAGRLADTACRPGHSLLGKAVTDAVG